jgi:4-amino-4-deoxy-L-arabinose transferase-like glycosyltransferase
MPRVLRARDVIVWALGFLAISTWLVAAGFESDDPDSALYAALSARLAEGPLSRWIAPEWWGHWDSEGLFREHPAGVFIAPALLGSVGVPGVQAAYIAGMAAALGCLVVLATLVARATSAEHGRLALILLQMMPLAFIFRIRANHEYPMLLCLLGALLGFDAARRSWRWIWVPAVALSAALLIKGVFVAIPLLASALWILVNPLRAPESLTRPAIASVLSVAAMIVIAIGYDALYLRVTGETFWGPYWARQLAPLTLSTPIGGGSTFLHHLWFYTLRVIWHPAPWSFALAAAAWTSRKRLSTAWRQLEPAPRRGLVFTLLFAGASVLLLSTPSRFAERYTFSANYAVATAGVVAALRIWPRLTGSLKQWDDRVVALPALCWMLLMALRLLIGPLLPRISQ